MVEEGWECVNWENINPSRDALQKTDLILGYICVKGLMLSNINIFNH